MCREEVKDMEQKRVRKSPARVASIENEYVRSLQQKQERRQAQKTRLYRRLAVFAVFAVLILGVLTHTFLGQKKVLATKMEEKEALLAELEEVEAEQDRLTKQLVKLDDDEYIAKLARQRYFVSEKNEIIFSIPKEDELNEKKSGEKE